MIETIADPSTDPCSPSTSTTLSNHYSRQLALDESQSLRSVDADILLVVIGIISIAAVRVLGVTV